MSLYFKNMNLFGGNNNDNSIFIYSIIIAVIFFIFIMPFIETCQIKDKENFEAQLDNILKGEPKALFNNKCSRSCCLNTGWPYPPELLEKDLSPEELKKYIPTNFTCSLGSNIDGGCLCVTKEDKDYLTIRAGNSRYNDN